MCTLLEIMQIIIIIRGAAQDVLERRLNNQYSPRKFRLLRDLDFFIIIFIIIAYKLMIIILTGIIH